MNNSDNINFKNEMSHKDFEELLEILKSKIYLSIIYQMRLL